MNINTDNLEEIKQMLEYALEYRSWPNVEDALAILNEELGYENEENTDDDQVDEE
jgi:hypothetical protein